MACCSFLKTFLLVSSLSLLTLFDSFLQASPSIPSLSSSSSFVAAAGRPLATKIYVYDLPSKFTYGVIRSYDLARNPHATTTTNDALRYPGHQHSAEWYLFSDLLHPDRRPDSSVHRVSDPEEADLFYVVPFFSSLSLIVNPIRAANADTESKKAYSLARPESCHAEQENFFNGQCRARPVFLVGPTGLGRASLGQARHGLVPMSIASPYR